MARGGGVVEFMEAQQEAGGLAGHGAIGEAEIVGFAQQFREAGVIAGLDLATHGDAEDQPGEGILLGEVEEAELFVPVGELDFGREVGEHAFG